MSKFDPHRYTISVKLVTLEEGDHYEAVVSELPDLAEYGETYEQAYKLAVESIEDLHQAAIEQGRDFPHALPSNADLGYSGRVTLRLAKSLHASASRLAELDGVSLNSWIVEAVAVRVGAVVSTSTSWNSNKPAFEGPRAFNFFYLSGPSAVTRLTTSARWVTGSVAGTAKQ